MGKPGFYLYTGDLLKDTACLTPEAFGVYCRWLFGPLLQNQGSVTWPILALANVAVEGIRTRLGSIEMSCFARPQVYWMVRSQNERRKSEGMEHQEEPK